MKKSYEELKNLIQDAKSKIKLGENYVHYKSDEMIYTPLDIVIIEATQEIGVTYRAEYESFKDIIFLRPVEDFLAEVEKNGQTVRRFRHI